MHYAIHRHTAAELIYERDENIICCCMNDRQGDLVCIFVYEFEPVIEKEFEEKEGSIL